MVFPGPGSIDLNIVKRILQLNWVGIAEGLHCPASAQGELGASLYRHFGVEIDTTYLLIKDGHCWGMSGGYLRLLPVLGCAWRLLEITRLIPEAIRDTLYRLVARNRYRWFGHHEHCSLLTPEQRSRLVG